MERQGRKKKYYFWCLKVNILRINKFWGFGAKIAKSAKVEKLVPNSFPFLVEDFCVQYLSKYLLLTSKSMLKKEAHSA